MMKQKDKNIEAIAKLIELTQEGKINWSLDREIDKIKENPNDIIQSAYKTTYKERLLRIYKRTSKTQSFYPEFGDSYPTWEWTTNIKLQVITPDNIVLWTFPETNAIYDLFTSVEYQVSNIKDFLDDLTSDEDVPF